MDRAAKNRDRFVTTDYVLDETATLLKMRGHPHLLRGFFETVLSSPACRVEWTDAERFSETSRFFLKRLDHRWSFTDCLSFFVMKETGIQAALTKDSHFDEAGFAVVLR
jgi:predicted nucleic acid-binding protein